MKCSRRWAGARPTPPGDKRMSRPRGFIEDYRPQAKTRALLASVGNILRLYSAQLPLSIRQIFYRLVAAYAYEKTEQAYNRLIELLNKARRARLIPMDAIRDDGFVERAIAYYDDVADFIETVRLSAQEMRLDRQIGQAQRLVLWCEASGMVPQLERIADPFGITVCSSGGTDSLTAKHRMASRWARAGKPITLLHLGDYDPSGSVIGSALAEDLKAFGDTYGADIEFVRLAVTAEQARQLSLPSQPPKREGNSHARSFIGEETWQCEALDPQTLADIVQGAIEQRIDRDIYEAVVAAEANIRQDVFSRFEGLRS